MVQIKTQNLKSKFVPIKNNFQMALLSICFSSLSSRKRHRISTSITFLFRVCNCTQVLHLFWQWAFHVWRNDRHCHLTSGEGSVCVNRSVCSLLNTPLVMLLLILKVRISRVCVDNVEWCFLLLYTRTKVWAREVNERFLASDSKDSLSNSLSFSLMNKMRERRRWWLGWIVFCISHLVNTFNQSEF